MSKAFFFLWFFQNSHLSLNLWVKKELRDGKKQKNLLIHQTSQDAFLPRGVIELFHPQEFKVHWKKEKDNINFQGELCYKFALWRSNCHKTRQPSFGYKRPNKMQALWSQRLPLAGSSGNLSSCEVLKPSWGSVYCWYTHKNQIKASSFLWWNMLRPSG